MARQSLRSFFVLLLLGVILLSIALVVRSGMWASKTHDEPINATMRAALAESQPELSTQDSLLVYRLYPTAFVSSSGLHYVVRQPGKGPLPQPGSTVRGYYAVRLLDGTEIENTYAQTHPVEFRLHDPHVMPALSEAFAAMRPGEKRTLIVPYWLGYPAGARPKGVGPHTTVIVEAERL